MEKGRKVEAFAVGNLIVEVLYSDVFDVVVTDREGREVDYRERIVGMENAKTIGRSMAERIAIRGNGEEGK